MSTAQAVLESLIKGAMPAPETTAACTTGPNIKQSANNYLHLWDHGLTSCHRRERGYFVVLSGRARKGRIT